MLESLAYFRNLIWVKIQVEYIALCNLGAELLFLV